MKVSLLAHTPEPEKVIACAAKLCYSGSTIDRLYDGLTGDKAADFVDMLASMGHESPIEHVTFTFGIEGVSRALTHQLVRHRIASFSQQSQRYVNASHFSYVTPPEIASSEAAEEVFHAAMDAANEAYHKLAAILKDKHEKAFLSAGLSEKEAAAKAEKKAIEDARFILPNACDTKIIVTMNARSLYNFFRHRCCNRAQWEIKALADEMLRLVKDVAPTLFRTAGPSCMRGSCPEGKMSCGQAASVRAYYKAFGEKR